MVTTIITAIAATLLLEYAAIALSVLYRMLTIKVMIEFLLHLF